MWVHIESRGRSRGTKSATGSSRGLDCPTSPMPRSPVTRSQSAKPPGRGRGCAIGLSASRASPDGRCSRPRRSGARHGRIHQRSRAYRRVRGGGVRAMTIHQAKNREFHSVIVLWPYEVAGEHRATATPAVQRDHPGKAPRPCRGPESRAIGPTTVRRKGLTRRVPVRVACCTHVATRLGWSAGEREQTTARDDRVVNSREEKLPPPRLLNEERREWPTSTSRDLASTS